MSSLSAYISSMCSALGRVNVCFCELPTGTTSELQVGKKRAAACIADGDGPNSAERLSEKSRLAEEEPAAEPRTGIKRTASWIGERVAAMQGPSNQQRVYRKMITDDPITYAETLRYNKAVVKRR